VAPGTVTINLFTIQNVGESATVSVTYYW